MVPESPAWLAAQGRAEEAEGVLRRVARANGRALPQGRLIVSTPPPAESPWKQVGRLVKPGRRAITAAVYFLWLASNVAYFGSVLLQPDLLAAEDAGSRCSYGPPSVHAISPLFQASPPSTCTGALPASDYLQTLWAATGELPGLAVSVAFVDWFGRRPSMGYFFLLCTAAFLALLPCTGRLAETAAFFAACAASGGFVQTIVVYTVELETTDVRSTSLGVASGMGRIGMILTPIISQFFDKINFVFAVVAFSAVCLLGYSTAMWLPVETAGRPLFTSSDELIDALQTKHEERTVSFANDPDVNPEVRCFRWRAPVDGYARRDSPGVSSREGNV